MPAKGVEVATRLRPTAIQPLPRHGAKVAEVPTTITGCTFLPRTSSENTDNADTVIVGLTLICPGGTDLTATDRVRRELDGKVYEIDGEPGDYRKRGRSKAVIVALKRVTG